MTTKGRSSTEVVDRLNEFHFEGANKPGGELSTSHTWMFGTIVDAPLLTLSRLLSPPQPSRTASRAPQPSISLRSSASGAPSAIQPS